MNDDSPTLDLHRCDALPTSGVAVAWGQGFGDVCQDAWHLHLVRKATESDLEQSGVLEEIGEPIWSVCAEIRCCPYCGVTLPTPVQRDALSVAGGADTETIADETAEDGPPGAFALFDQERWTGRLR